jgi:hypothetical protein
MLAVLDRLYPPDEEPGARPGAVSGAGATMHDPARRWQTGQWGTTIDALRADALCEAVLGGTTIPGKGILVHVTVSADTLLGLDEKPGELSGHGPLPASVTRRLAATDDATWKRILTDPVTGTVRDLGTTRYQPPRALRDLIKARDQVCRHPTCSRPADHCDIDHLQPFPTGPTAEDNLADLCRHHHLIKTHCPGWEIRLAPDGTVWTTTPTGHHYPDRPLPADPPDHHRPDHYPPDDHRPDEDPPPY